jgi:SAM-dependent methyltransferase
MFNNSMRRLLRGVFRFDEWHIAPYNARPYAKLVVDELNTLPLRSSVVEIGCGLGDILRRLRFSQKRGLDQDSHVLNAAAFLTRISNPGGGKTVFKTATFPDQHLVGNFDAIVLVNWIHHLAPEVLKASLERLVAVNLNFGGVLVFDVVANESYRYNHDWKYLTGELDCRTRLVGPLEYGRYIVFVEKGEF